MAIHATHLPGFRQAPQRREYLDTAPSERFSWAHVIPMARLNELTSDATFRLHATSVFVIGVALFVAALAII